MFSIPRQTKNTQISGWDVSLLHNLIKIIYPEGHNGRRCCIYNRDLTWKVNVEPNLLRE